MTDVISANRSRRSDALFVTEMHVLLELRPALDGHAGIPQETRLLFQGLCRTPGVYVAGMLQTSHRYLPSGIGQKREPDRKALDPAHIFHRMSRIIIALETKPITSGLDGVSRYLKIRRNAWMLALASMLDFKRGTIRLSRFVTTRFEDYVWRHLFARTLPSDDFPLITNQDFRICGTPWNLMHSAGLNTLRWRFPARYPLLDTQGFDFFIAQTPYPGRIPPETRLIVRYHDAFPIFMPHTIAHKSRHELTHYHALCANVANGAYFACVSDATRADLLKLFPELGDRAVTIPNMVSAHFHDEPAPDRLVSEILRSCSSTNADTESEIRPKVLASRHESPIKTRYLLVVSTIEPRKNHDRLLAAWARFRTEYDADLKLVLVGGMGWESEEFVQRLKPWIDQEALFTLRNVPAEDLRVLYQHALATVCPSLGEGFDYSGVEAMRSGGVVIASDIPVHHEVYDDAALYFDPYSTDDLVGVLANILHKPDSEKIREQLRQRGAQVSQRYLPEHVRPLWEKLFLSIHQAKATNSVTPPSTFQNA